MINPEEDTKKILEHEAEEAEMETEEYADCE